MRREGVKDERIIGESQRLGSHGFIIVFVGLMISVLVKVFILQWEMKYWLDTFLILMAACAYYTVRSVNQGLLLFPGKAAELQRLKKRNWIAVSGGTLVYFGLNLSLDWTEGGDPQFATSVMGNLVGAVVFFFAMTWVHWYIIKLSTQKADKKLE